MQRFLAIGEVARRLRLSVDKVRQLADDGEIKVRRTEGGHRRFTEEAVERFETRQRPSKRSRSRPARSRKKPVNQVSPSVFDESDGDDFELDDDFLDEEPMYDVVNRPSPRQVQSPTASHVSLARRNPPVLPSPDTAKAAAEREQTAREEQNRLQSLKNLGTMWIPYDVPTVVRAKIIEELEGYVTSEKLPAWVSSFEQHNFVRGRVDAIVQAYRKQVADEEERKKAEQARQVAALKAKAESDRQVQALITQGMAYADQDLEQFDFLDCAEIRSDVERALREEVKADWSQRDVEMLVDEVMDEPGEEDD
jgi:excisionase family DNA binding protein